jgi:hypothetical protein
MRETLSFSSWRAEVNHRNPLRSDLDHDLGKGKGPVKAPAKRDIQVLSEEAWRSASGKSS